MVTPFAGNSPTMSIGMPTYNHSNLITRAIESLLNQSFHDFELIISDNASSDDTQIICQAYASRDPRIRYIRKPINIGAAANFEFVLKSARGIFFMWAASDDWWDQKFLETLHCGFKNHPECAAMFCTCALMTPDIESLVREINYNYGGNAVKRLFKFCYYYEDICFYGLYRLSIIQDERFATWWGINRKTTIDAVYPFIAYVLASGNWITLQTRPLYFKHFSFVSNHHISFSNKLSKNAAYVIRKFNVFYESIRAVHRGSKSLLLVLVTMPAFLGRFMYDGTSPIRYLLRQLYTSRHK